MAANDNEPIFFSDGFWVSKYDYGVTIRSTDEPVVITNCRVSSYNTALFRLDENALVKVLLIRLLQVTVSFLPLLAMLVL